MIPRRLEQFFEPGQPLILSEGGSGFGLPVADLNYLVVLLFLAQMKKVRIEWRVVGPEVRYSSTSG